MTKTNSSRPEEGAPGGSEQEGGFSSAPSSVERVRELLQSEIDKLGPLDGSGRAAALIGESSIRFTDEPGTPGFVIVGADGQPRTSVRDGHPTPLTMHDLAAELRKNYPALFKPAASGTTSAPLSEREVPSPPRDWLMIGSGESKPRISAEVRPLIQTVVDGLRRTLTQAPAKVETPSESPEPARRMRAPDAGLDKVSNVTLTTSAFRPSYLIYAGLVILIAIALTLIFSGPGKDTGASNAPGEQALPRPGAGSSGTLAPAQQPASGPKPPLTVSGIPEVVDTSTLSVDGKIVRLFGVEWERGAQAEDLTRYIRGRQVVCAPAVRSDRYRCQIEGRDLSEVILYNGGGRATHEATPELKAAEEKARASGIGVWQKP